jgi:hypothetical protein
MATEGPLIHDGSQCTAAVNMSSTAGLAGFNGTGQFLLVKITAARALSPVALATDIVYGVLQNDPIAGFICDVGIFGITKVIVGAAVSAGAALMADTSGRAITGVAASTNQIFGQALEAATAANQVIVAKVFCFPALYNNP